MTPDDDVSPTSPTPVELGPLRFGRKAFLIAAGLGTVAVGAWNGLPPATADDTGPQPVADDPILAGDRFPIGLFWPPPPFQTTLQRYREIRDAGFTFVISGNYLNDRQILDYALSMCDQTGLDMLVVDPQVAMMTSSFTISDSAGDFHLSRAEARQILSGAIDHYAGSGWRIVDGALQIHGGSGDGSIGLTTAGAGWTDYSLSFDLRLLDTTAQLGYSQGGWVFRAKDAGTGYVWLLSDHKSGAPDAPGHLTKAVFDGGALISVEVKPLEVSIRPQQTYRVVTTVVGDTITTTIDGVTVDTTTNGRFTTGRIGFREAGSESASYDNVTVTAADGTTLFSDAFGGDLVAWQPPASTGHPSFAGLVLFDEPSGAKVADLGTVVDLMQGLGEPYLPYVNLLPGLGAGYLDQARTIGSPVLSFDRYPLLSGGIDQGYFANWADVRDAADKLDVPSWTFIQSVGYNGHALPTMAGMLWQVNISLAYGCKGIQYFTYWTPDPARGEGFESALISVDGRRTARYDGARKINTGYLQPVGSQLRPLRNEAVFAVNLTDPPDGLPALGDDPLIRGAAGDPVVIGRFSGSEGAPQQVLVVNYSATDSAPVELHWQSAVNGVEVFDPERRHYRRSDLDTRYRLPPGGGVLLRVQ